MNQFELLHAFSIERAYRSVPLSYQPLLKAMEVFSVRYNFPAVSHDVGAFLTFLVSLHNPQTIFEFGSGYGQSAFWMLMAQNPALQKIHLTERREMIWPLFQQLPWPQQWINKINYFQGNAFQLLPQLKAPIDLLFMDGQKSAYPDFFYQVEKQLSANALIVIDNVYWKGNIQNSSTLVSKSMSPQSVEGIRELLLAIEASNRWSQHFLPFEDGLLLLLPFK